jgi:activator of 2-hydroxyglutaryl-CoA dehydratase
LDRQKSRALARGQDAALSSPSEKRYFELFAGGVVAGAFGAGVVDGVADGVVERGIAEPAPEPVVVAAGGVAVLLAVLVLVPPQ